MKKRQHLINLLLLLVTNSAFRLSLSLFFGMMVNIFYIAGNLFSGFIHKNIWSAALTVYHSLFLVIRFYLVSAKRRLVSEEEIRKACLRSGIFLLLLDISAGAIMIYTIRLGSRISYTGIVLLGFVIYTVYSVATSIFGIKKSQNDNQPLHFAMRNMTLASALMSVFNLQYSVLLSIGISQYITNRIIVILGFMIFFFIILLGVRLVYKNLRIGSKI